MPAIPLQRQYGPTLGELLAPRWRRVPRTGRALAIIAGVVLAVALAGAVATLRHPRFAHGGPVSFSFAYPGLYRASPPTGADALVRRTKDGRVEDSFAVAPLTLASYRGEPSGALALYAAGDIRRLAAVYPGFKLRGEGWTQLNSISPYAVYNVFFRARIEGREMYGRDVLLLPERAGARRGLAISMLTAVGANKQVDSPLLVGAKGALAAPLGSFQLG
ncbi:MAG TPA: hypothetical protein VGI76_00575 [Solirubrobacteraceae bacterium]